MSARTQTNAVYRAIDDLIDVLSAGRHSKLASILDHRVHKVAWTSGEELLEELKRVLSNALTSGEIPQGLPEEKIREVVSLIDAFLGSE